MSEDELYVHQCWAIADELCAARFPVAALHVLEGLLARPIPVMLVDAEILTRLRVAEIILSEGLHPELARRCLEPGRELCLRHSIDPISKVELYRLLSICARRKHNQKLAVSLLTESANFITEQRNRKGTLDAKWQSVDALVHLELSRTWYSRLLENNFVDEEAAAQLARVSSVYNKFALRQETSSIAVTLCICHVYGLLCSSRMQEIPAQFQQATALFGDMTEIMVLRGLVDYLCFEGGVGALSSASHGGESPSSPLKKRLRSDSGFDASGPPSSSGVVWLSEGALFALDQLTEMLRQAPKTSTNSGSSSPATLDNAFTSLVCSVDDQMKRLTAVKMESSVSGMLQSSNSELRFLVAVKICAFCEIAAHDLTKLNLATATTKLHSLCQYLQLFQKHSNHFLFHAHILIAALFSTIAIGLQEDCDDGLNVAAASHHFQSAIGCAVDPQSIIVSKLFRCALFWNLSQQSVEINATTSSSSSSTRKSRDEALRRFSQAFDELKESYNSHRHMWTPRLKSVMLLLCGAASLQEYDYASAITTLKSAAEIARKCMGMASPLLATSLRLLAVAHHLSGSGEASDIALTTATQLSTRCNDESSLMHCIHWTLSRMVLSCDSDVKHRDQLLRSINNSSERFSVQLSHVASTQELEFLRNFGAGGGAAKGSS